MAKKSLETAAPINNTKRSKPMVAKAGITRRRTPYKCGGKISK